MGIFDRFRSRGKRPPFGQTLAMVLLPEESPPDAEAIFAYLRNEWPDSPSILNVETDGGITTGRFADGALAVAYIPIPIPAGELDGPIALAWHWPEARERVPEHRSHVIVHVGGARSPVELHLLHSRTVAATVATSRAIGVYVGNAMLVRDADSYVSEAHTGTADAVPVTLWVGFNLVAEDSGFSGYSTGLTRFGLQELEVRRSNREPMEILGTLADTAAYQLQSGMVLDDGDTFGTSEFERLRVRYDTSEFLQNEQVTLLEL